MKQNYPIGVDLGGTKLLIIAGEHRRCVPTGLFYSFTQVESEIERFIHHYEINPIALGIALPGLVEDGRVVKACDVLPGIVGWNPVQAFSQWDCPVRAMNDVQAALAEEFYDAAPGVTGGVIMVGTAIGAAFQVAGVPLLGSRGVVPLSKGCGKIMSKSC
jgi:glucokinase